MSAFCETCKYWVRGVATITHGKWKDYPAGDCRRGAPTTIGGLHGPEQTVWPKVSLNDWCGEHVHHAASLSDPELLAIFAGEALA